MRRLFVVALALGLAQCGPKAEPPALPPLPTKGYVEVEKPSRVVAIDDEKATKTVFAQPVVLNGTAAILQAAHVECRLADGDVLAGDLPSPLAAGAIVIVPVWPTGAITTGKLLPVLESCGLTSATTGLGQVAAPAGQRLNKIAEADFRPADQGQVQ